MKFTLDIDLGNDAMRSPEDIAHALETVAHRLRNESDGDTAPIRDTNGNTVGEWAYRGSAV